MTRGSTSSAAGSGVLKLPGEGKTKVVKTQKMMKKANGKKKAVLKDDSKTKKEVVDLHEQVAELKAVNDYTDKDIRRTAHGRAAIRSLIEDLFEIDAACSSGNPAFDDQMKCRVKFPGAGTLSWPKMLDAAPKAFEQLHLGHSWPCLC